MLMVKIHRKGEIMKLKKEKRIPGVMSLCKWEKMKFSALVERVALDKGMNRITILTGDKEAIQARQRSLSKVMREVYENSSWLFPFTLKKKEAKL